MKYAIHIILLRCMFELLIIYTIAYSFGCLDVNKNDFRADFC